MQLADPKEVDDLSVQVIQHLNHGRLLMEEHLRASGERFDIRRVLRKERDGPFGKRAFSTNVRKRSDHVLWA